MVTVFDTNGWPEGITDWGAQTKNNTDVEINVEINSKLGEAEHKALVIIGQKPNITLTELAKAMNKSYNSAEVATRSLKKKGYIKRAGSRKSGYWEVLK